MFTVPPLNPFTVPMLQECAVASNIIVYLKIFRFGLCMVIQGRHISVVANVDCCYKYLLRALVITKAGL